MLSFRYFYQLLRHSHRNQTLVLKFKLTQLIHYFFYLIFIRSIYFKSFSFLSLFSLNPISLKIKDLIFFTALLFVILMFRKFCLWIFWKELSSGVKGRLAIFFSVNERKNKVQLKVSLVPIPSSM